MAFLWSEKRIQWYLDASRYCDFHEQLAKKIKPHLLPTDKVCDLGCGLGRLDLQLAPFVSHITCVDIDKTVLAHLEQDAQDAQIQNLSILCSDADDIHTVFDAVIMTFFGTPAQRMLDCMALAKRTVIRVINIHDKRALAQPKNPRKKRETAQDVANILDGAGFSYKLHRDTFEFGQPLRTVAQAQAFMQCNNPEMTQNEIQAFLQTHLEKTGEKEFPYYLPGQKELGIFVIRAYIDESF